MLNNLTTPHTYPGKLFLVEGIDGSGKTTQLGLVAKWLSAADHRVFITEWNSSALIKAATKTGKRKNSLTPTTFSLLHATDFADRLLYRTIPPLKAGMIVLTDRYAALGEEFGFRIVESRPRIDGIQAELRRQIGAFLDVQTEVLAGAEPVDRHPAQQSPRA